MQSLSTVQKSNLHKKLIEAQSYCRVRLADLNDERQAPERGPGDVGDRSAKTGDLHFCVSEMKRIEVKLTRTSATLKRFNDDYGYCAECDSDIGHKRLEFDPTLELCIDCASIKEMQGGR